MAVVTYQCTTCHRQTDIIQNQQGLEWVGHCNITLGCRGTLYQVEVKPDYIRGVPTPDVVGLKNWVQRKVLFNFTQGVANTQWVIQHDLGTAPSVVVYINQPTVSNPNNQVEVLPQEIVYNTDDQLTLIFSTAYSGIAQCIARSSNPDILSPRPTPPVVTTPPTVQLSNQGIVTIATRVLTIGDPTNVSISLAYTLGSSTSPTDITYIASNVPSDLSPWSDTSSVVVRGKTYTVRTFNVQTAQTTSGQVSDNSSVQLLSINSTGQFNIPVVSVALQPTNQFVVDGDYHLYFFENAVFQTINTGSVDNNIPWVAATDASYDPNTNQTTITVSNNVTGSFAIPGTQIVCSGVRQVAPGEMLILLGTTPFTIFDKITNEIIDFTVVNNAGTQFDIFFEGNTNQSTPQQVFFNGGDLFASTSIVTTVYPPVQSVT